jgi:dihydroorotate dehydrogenase
MGEEIIHQNSCINNLSGIKVKSKIIYNLLCPICIFAFMYRLLRKIFFLFPAETAHYLAMNGLSFLCSIGLKKLIRSGYGATGGLGKELCGLHFTNPVGLAAGFDKNARYLRELEALGFGFVEIGTVTPLPQEGNEKPRLFRLPKDKALINRMGFNNEGMEAIAARLQQWRRKNPSSALIIGGNIGKNKVTPNEEAVNDYEKCFGALFDYVDYFVVNVSSPNTPGLRALQDKESLRKILTRLQEMGHAKPVRPIFLKIAPDLEYDQVDEVIDLALEIKLDGLVIANTTTSRNGLQTDATAVTAMGAGGLSGLPVKERATTLIGYVHRKTAGEIPIIGSGGVFTGPDAQEKFAAGAALVQVWTGFIYEGPAIVKKITRFLSGATKNRS